MSYDIRRSNFRSQIDLNQGVGFDRPNWMEIEFVTAGKFVVSLRNVDSGEVLTASRDNSHGGWHTFHFRQPGEFGSGIYTGRHVVTLKNPTSSTELTVRGGTLYYGDDN